MTENVDHALVAGPLTGKVTLVAGATRGAGRGTAVSLGEAGATVYCTGRTTRERSSEYDRPETIEETADLVTAAGGKGIAVEVDHLEPTQVEALVERIDAASGRLDVLVNDIWGGELLFEWETPLWEHDLENGLRILRLAIDTHLITSHFALPLLIREPGGLVVEMTDGTREYNAEHYRVSAFYDLAKTAAIRLAFAQSVELAPHGCTAVALTPGWLRSEMMLERYGVTEENWRDGAAVNPHFAAISESPRFVGRAVAALAAVRSSNVATAARSRPAASRASTASPTSTAPDPTAGATSSKCKMRAGRQTPRATADGAADQKDAKSCRPEGQQDLTQSISHTRPRASTRVLLQPLDEFSERLAPGSPGPLLGAARLRIARPYGIAEAEDDLDRLVLRHADDRVRCVTVGDPVRRAADALVPGSEQHVLRAAPRVERDVSLAADDERDHERRAANVALLGHRFRKRRLRLPREEHETPGLLVSGAAREPACLEDPRYDLVGDRPAVVGPHLPPGRDREEGVHGP
jgi:NAD(P)-dependent dehydrogenase (short-subunit alcohol dehydrogenase family)